MTATMDNPRNVLMYQIAITGEKSMAQIGRENGISRAGVQDICRRVAKELGMEWNAPKKSFRCISCGDMFNGSGTYYGAKAKYCEEHRGRQVSRSATDIPIANGQGAI